MTDRDSQLSGQYDPDELEEFETKAERRGTSRGLVIGLLIAAAVAVAAIVFIFINPLAPKVAPDNTVPVTSLPQATEVAVPETLIVTATPAPTVTVTQTPAPDAEAPQVSLSRASWIPDQKVVSAAALISTTETGGSCTLLITNGPESYSASAQVTAATSADAQSASCIVNVRDESLKPGDWNAVMQYSGPAGEAQSAPLIVTVT